MTKKEFWKVIKPALSNKGVISSDVIILEENGKWIKTQLFKNHYINIMNLPRVHPLFH